MRKIGNFIGAFVLTVALAACGSSQAPVQSATADSTVPADPVLLVNPFVGTQTGATDFGTGGGAGNTFPGATLPFGMVQFSPDTSFSDNFGGGYSYADTKLKGFSLTHISGAGCAIFQDIGVLPLAKVVTASPVPLLGAGLLSQYLATFDHASEHAQPGDYSVRLNPATTTPIDVELTATLRGGMARIAYPQGTPASLLINAGNSAMGNGLAQVQIDPVRHEVSGSASSGRFCYQDNRYTVYFVAEFDQPFATYATWQKQLLVPSSTSATDISPLPLDYQPLPGGPSSLPGNPSTGAQAGAVLGFAPQDGAPVIMRVAISFVSIDNARANLQAELAGRDFDSVRTQAHQIWRKALSQIEISGVDRPRARVFYTALYHALLSPTVFSDVNGDYIGMDNAIHHTARLAYANYSGWDIYRSQTPLLAMLDPQRSSDMVQSLVDNAAQSGWLPKWSFANQQSDTMVGDPADPIIAGSYAFGARDFDTAAALDAMIKGATQPGQSGNPASLNNGYAERPGLTLYSTLGYIPKELDVPVLGNLLPVVSSQLVWGTAATTLEYALDDFAIGRFAGALGQSARVSAIGARAGNWKNLFNPASGYIEPRSATGIFLPGYGTASGDGFVEGNSAQYTWFVPQDMAGLIATLGGTAAAQARLDTFFTKLNAGPQAPYAFLGNEPTLFTPWLYAWLQQPAKTAPIVREALTTLYDDTPKGMPGNDDLGTMSAWWVLAALGLDPGIPGTDVLLLNPPLIPQAVVHLPGGDLRISGGGSGGYVQSLALNGTPLDRAWLHFSEIAKGGTLRYVPGAAPSDWATDTAAVPPSFASDLVAP
ncbi:MAG: GH92 family glycosyl hydrolase [Stenotrophobium sp.]